LPATYVRTTFPKKEEVDHELHVVSVVKKLKSEAVALGFKLNMMDENYIKRNKKGPKKKKYYPDVYAQMVFDLGEEYNVRDLAVEIDNGTMGTERMFKKAKSLYEEMEWVSFILVPSVKRLETLQLNYTKFIEKQLEKHEVATSEAKVKVLLRCAVFAIRPDFESLGFLDSLVIRYDGTKIKMLPDDYIPVR
jgi:hypothetical protein